MRSFLFVPAGSEKMLAKSVASTADVVILDLEDAVQPSAKSGARSLLAAHLASRPKEGPRVAVRVNDLSTVWIRDDLAAVMPHAPDLVMLPKTRGPGDVAELGARLATFGATGASMGILAIATETVESVLSLASASWAHPRLKGLLWGGEDLAACLGSTANRTPDGAYSSPFRLARDLCLMAAKRAGVLAIDAVSTEFVDMKALAAEAEAARRDGFDGKAAIHPAQLDVINRIFRPSDAERAWAEAVLRALRHAETGVAVLDGQMIDAPHAARARRILAET